MQAVSSGNPLSTVTALARKAAEAPDSPTASASAPIAPIHKQPSNIVDCAPSDGRGLAVICMDGLSYPAMQKAIKDGLMPNVKKLLEVQGHVARPFIAGVPCTTPASLVGFSYGFNDRIPGFVWYDKAADTWYSAKDWKTFRQGFEGPNAAHGGPGLFTKGSVSSSIVAGGSTDTHMVLDTLSVRYQAGGTAAALKYIAPELGELAKNPVSGTSSLLRFPFEMLHEIYDDKTDASGIQSPAKDVLKRSFEGAMENVLMTDVATARIKEEMKHGVPVMFADLPGYDWSSHHHGPYSKQAMRHLRTIDKKIGQIYKAANKAGHRNYELVLISDHGQTPGLDWKVRYGQHFGDWVDSLVRPINPQETVLMGPSGSLEHMYFTSDKKQWQLSEIMQRYPDLLHSLVQNPGIDLVAAREGASTIIVGKAGVVTITGDHYTVQGQDVLASRGDSHLLAAQVAHVAQMPNSGDLIAFGHWDGNQVVTFVEDEDALGGHGGLGGDQDTPVLITEPGRKVDLSEVYNTEQMYPILRSFLPTDADPGSKVAGPSPVAPSPAAAPTP